MECLHEDLDTSDFCEDCGEHVQHYTTCTMCCGWIEITEFGAPELCEECEYQVIGVTR